MFAALRGAREVLFGNGQRNALALSVRQYGCRVFVCCDPFLAAGDEFGHVLDTLRAAGISVSVFDEVVADLPLGCVAAAVQSAQSYSPDIIIGFGGGRSIDLAKAVAVVLSHGGRIQDYYGELAVPGPVLPLIAMPATAGTGSEVTPVAVVSDHERGVKVGVSSPHLIPTIAICDPELTYTCPPSSFDAWIARCRNGIWNGRLLNQ